MNRGFQRTVAVAVAAVCLGGGSWQSPGLARQLGSETVTLLAGSTLEVPVDLEADAFIEYRVEGLSGGTTVALADPAGRPIAEGIHSGINTATLAAVTRAGGRHVLRFETPQGAPKEVRIRLAVIERRPATQADDLLLTALGTWKEAQRLKDQQTEESMLKGVALMESAADQLAWSGFPTHEARVRRELGDRLSTMGLNARAEAEYERAIDLLEESGDATALAQALNSHADLLTNRGDGDRAEGMYERALQLATRQSDLELQALTWNNLGVLSYHRGELDQAVETFEKALQLQLVSGADEERANTLANLGSVYRALGRYGEALKVSESALELARQLNDKQRELRVLNGRGVCLKAVGELRAATEAYLEALSLVELLGARDMEATVAGNLGTLYRLLGQEDRAREFLERSLASATAIGSASDQSWALLALGEVAREAGNERAVDYYTQAADLAKGAGDGFSIGHSFLGLGRSHLESGRPLEAVTALSQALAQQIEISDRPGQVAALRELGRAQSALGHADAARTDFERSLELAQLVGEPSKEAETRFRYAEFLLDDGDLASARGQASQASEMIETLRLTVIQPDLRAGLLSRSHQDFALLIEILARLEAESPGAGFGEEAFAVAERARARALVEYLTEARADLAEDVPLNFRGALEDISGRLSSLQQKLTRSLRQADLDTEAVEAVKSEIKALNQQREDLWGDIRVADTRWAALEYPEPLDATHARKLLSDDQALISFILGERESHAFLLSPGGVTVYSLPSENTLNPKIEEVRQLLETPGRRSFGRYLAVAGSLYDLILGPLEEEASKYEHLLIAADGALHYLPFEALVMGNPSNGVSSFLLSRWAVSYVPSASAMEALAARRPQGSMPGRTELAAFADPTLEGSTAADATGPVLRGLGDRESWTWRHLLGARDEVAAIAGLFDPSRTQVYLGADASEESFRTSRGVREARYLHVASHALIDNREPALSALLLAPSADGTYDGLLQTHEVFDLHLSADLVVLSGCETALGRAVRGEGLLGLTRAFLYAGAGSVAVSLWPIEDGPTASLMKSFYRELHQGGTTVEALRQAKLQRARDAATSHPYYWASFVLIGTP